MEPPEGNGNGNGKATLAVLSTKLDGVLEKLDGLCRDYKVDHDTLVGLKTKFEDIDTLKRALIGELVGIFFVAIISIIAIFTNTGGG